MKKSLLPKKLKKITFPFLFVNVCVEELTNIIW